MFVVNHTILCTEHFKRIDVMLSVITIKKGSFRRTMNNKKKKKKEKLTSLESKMSTSLPHVW